MMDRTAARKIAREEGIDTLARRAERAELRVQQLEAELADSRYALLQVLGEVAMQRDRAREWAVRLESELAWVRWQPQTEIAIDFVLAPPGPQRAKLTPEMAAELQRMAREAGDDV